jgi:aryl-alcohol dehydrogenase-like predicted oxidoreductase
MADWTAEAVQAGVDAALKRLSTDCIDIVHLHSCELPTLLAGGVVDALERARGKGKLRVAAYSGENEALAWAIESGRVGGLECSVNLFDQASLAERLPRAAERGIGVIAKRALGNAPWRFAERPVGDYCETYWDRMQRLAYDIAGLPWDELALRFSAWQPGVSCAIVGTTSIANLQRNRAIVEKGPLPADLVAEIRRRWCSLGADWRGEV